jgi:hypothetical protein
MFNSTLFIADDTPITAEQADKRYLRFPIAQGDEVLQNITTNAIALGYTTTPTFTSANIGWVSDSNTAITTAITTSSTTIYTSPSLPVGTYMFCMNVNYIQNTAGATATLTLTKTTPFTSIVVSNHYIGTAGVLSGISINEAYTLTGSTASTFSVVMSVSANTATIQSNGTISGPSFNIVRIA